MGPLSAALTWVDHLPHITLSIGTVVAVIGLVVRFFPGQLRWVIRVAKDWRLVLHGYWPCPQCMGTGRLDDPPRLQGEPCLLCMNEKMPARARFDDEHESLSIPNGHMTGPYLRRVWSFRRWRSQPGNPYSDDPFARSQRAKSV